MRICESNVKKTGREDRLPQVCVAKERCLVRRTSTVGILPVQAGPGHPFSAGTLCGDGHVIRGLSIALVEDDGPAGLISAMGGGTIQNLGNELAAEGVSSRFRVGGLWT